MIQFILWKAIQIHCIPIGLLNWWTVISSDNLSRVNHPVKITYIGGAF